MKVIFLDFDGVITTEASRWCLCAEKMELVKQIVDQTGAKIVISSSWRRNTLEKTIEKITEIGGAFIGNVPFLIPECVVGVTSRMYAFKYGDSSKHFLICRGEEISRYIDEHEEITNYVILDDDSDMLLSQSMNFVQTKWKLGICEADVLRAIDILKRNT